LEDDGGKREEQKMKRESRVNWKMKGEKERSRR